MAEATEYDREAQYSELVRYTCMRNKGLIRKEKEIHYKHKKSACERFHITSCGETMQALRHKVLIEKTMIFKQLKECR